MTNWLSRLARRDEGRGALGRHVTLLATLILMLIALPVVQILAGGAPRYPLLLVCVLVAAVFMNRNQHRLFAAVALVGGLSVAGIASSVVLDRPELMIPAEALGLLLLGFTTLVLLNGLVQAKKVSQDILVGGICAYLLIGLCYALLFILLVEVQPGSIVDGSVPIAWIAEDPSAHATKLIYFSFVTLTTLGYGDLSPDTDLAQMIAVAEALTGQLYLAIFIARLIGLRVGRGPSPR